MARQITCECGHVVRADSEQEVLDLTLEHLRENHPALVGRVTREDLVRLVEVVE